MKQTYSLSDLAAFSKDFFYAWSPNCKEHDPAFLQEADCVVNAASTVIDYQYISMISRERFPVGTRVTTHCSFEKFGAPLIVFTDDIGADSEGRPLYGLHFEAVAFEEGCNVWKIEKNPDTTAARKIVTEKIGLMRFPVADNSVIEVSVLFGEKKITVTVNGNSIDIEREEFPAEVHAGITACEGINRFYDFTVEIPD